MEDAGRHEIVDVAGAAGELVGDAQDRAGLEVAGGEVAYVDAEEVEPDRDVTLDHRVVVAVGRVPRHAETVRDVRPARDGRQVEHLPEPGMELEVETRP